MHHQQDASQGVDAQLAAYVREHNLACLVDTMVQHVLEERPEDPYTFLADRTRLEKSLRAKGRSLAPTL